MKVVSQSDQKHGHPAVFLYECVKFKDVKCPEYVLGPQKDTQKKRAQVHTWARSFSVRYVF